MRVRSILAGVLLVALAAPLGCATREIRTTVYNRSDVKVFVREHKRGWAVLPREFQHPVSISTERLVNILGAIDIRGRQAELAGIRAAFEPSQLPAIAEGLSRGLQEASSDQEVGVQVMRKQMQNFLFDRKRLTSFVAYVENDLLYLHMSRVDWEINELTKKNQLPIPRVSEHPMRFRVVPAQAMYQEGVYAISVEWQNPIFKRPVRRIDTEGERRERTILMEAPERPKGARPTSIPADVLPNLTSDQLRALADLTDARAQGQITEGHYRREREKILQEARDSATSD
jgi:hypothetical protein